MQQKIAYYGEYPPPFLEAEFFIKITERKGWYLEQINGIWHLCYELENLAFIDFGSADYRARGGKEYLVKAFKNLENKTIYDLTAGWGRDSWLLAYKGFNLIMLEKNPYLYILLKQGLDLANKNPKIFNISQRMKVIFSNSLDFLKNNELELNSAIYLDPMYPESKKTALVKKRMQILHSLLQVETENNDELLLFSLKSKAKKIIVKRPKNAEFLANLKANSSISSPNTRYDIYVNNEEKL